MSSTPASARVFAKGMRPVLSKTESRARSIFCIRAERASGAERLASTGKMGQVAKKQSRSELTGRLWIRILPCGGIEEIKLATTYSRGTYRATTIGKAAFDGRVRDGIGSDHSFMVTKK